MKYCEDNLKWPPQLPEFNQICLREQKNSRTYQEHEPKKVKETDYSIRRIIDEGAEICKKIKQAYPEASWTKVATMFTTLKENTRHFYPDYNDLKFLEQLSKYTAEDIIEAIGTEILKSSYPPKGYMHISSYI